MAAAATIFQASKCSRIAPFCRVDFRKYSDIFTTGRYTRGTGPPSECSGRFAFPPGMRPFPVITGFA